MAKGTGGRKKRCGKGKSCGASCIYSRKLCLIGLPLAPRFIRKLRDRVFKRKRPNSTPTAIQAPKAQVSPPRATPKAQVSPPRATPKAQVSPPRATPKAQVSPPRALPKEAPPGRTPTAIQAPKAQVSPPRATPKETSPQVSGTSLDAKKVSEKLRRTLPGFEIKTPSPSYLELERNIDGNKLKISLSNRTLQFTVNGKTTSEDLPRATSVKVAVAVHSATSKLMKTLPNGTILEVKAETSDGKGAKRAKWFEKEGFSRPSFVGGSQTGKVVDGKLTPFNPKQEFSESSKPEFKEMGSRASSISGWHFILFGNYPEKG